jgi:AAA family ATP:ADP antiporter
MVLAIGGAAAFLLFGYEFVRAVSSSLYIGAFGAERLPIVMALSPVATVAFVYVYGLLLSRLGARHALSVTTLASAAVVTACYVALQARFSLAAGVLYVFREAYIVLLVEQYWSFINSRVSQGQARWVNGPITGLGSLGAMAGGYTVKHCATGLGSETLLLFAAVSLVPAALLSSLAYRYGGEPQPAEDERGGRHGHLALGLFRSPYLVLLALLIIATQVVSTGLDLRFSGLVQEAITAKDQRTAFFGGFYFQLNCVAFALQFGITPLLLRLLPLWLIHGLIPAVHVVAGTVLLVAPSLRVGATAFLLFKALDYSLFRAAKEILYIPLSYDARYRAKSLIDAFGYRFAKGSSSGLLALAGLLFGKLPVAVYPAMAVLAAFLWLPMAVVLALWRQPRAGALPTPTANR